MCYINVFIILYYVEVSYTIYSKKVPSSNQEKTSKSLDNNKYYSFYCTMKSSIFVSTVFVNIIEVAFILFNFRPQNN